MDQRLLANLLFWQDVTDYGAEEDRAADRLLRMGHAWGIFSKFIMDGGMWNIGRFQITHNMIENIHVLVDLVGVFFYIFMQDAQNKAKSHSTCRLRATRKKT